MQQEALSTRPPALLNRDDDFIQRVLRDVYSADVNRIVTDSHTGLKRVKQHLTNWSGGRMPQRVLVDHHRERGSLLEYFRVNAAIREALKPRVDLPSGGYIIIEPTEALTVIDVNSGSFTRSATSRETVLWTNCEAAEEIARQLRLRNLAGVIIVDFIDMDSRRDQLQVLENFNKALRSDKSRPQISQLSELGLVELTRKRQGQNLYELFGKSCPTCGGLGHLVQLPGETESADLTVPETGRESRGRPMSHPSLREGNGEELEPHADLQDLELLNHPSYQEQGNKGNRRKRRRESPPASRSNGRRDSNSRSFPAPVVKEAREALPESQDDPEPVKEAVAETATTPRSGRGRNGRGDRKPSTPPEVVTVEMTPDEQRIYAMMGVSPLALSPQTVKDPKNTVITVLLPGQAAPAPAVQAVPVLKIDEASDETNDAKSDAKADAAATAVAAPIKVVPSPQPTTKGAKVEASVANGKAVSTEPEPAAVPREDVAPEPAPESETDEPAPRRRRRRRSSASNE